MSDTDTMNDNKMEAEIIFETHLPDALRRALEYAGDHGFVASLPQLLHARVTAPFDNDIWDTWFFTSNSEESMVTTPQGNHVAVLVHGGGIFSTPARFRKLYLASTDRHSKDGFTGLFGGKILEQEAHDILEGRCPDGAEIPVFSDSEFRQGITDLPRRYAVVMDFETARTSKCGLASVHAQLELGIEVDLDGVSRALAEFDVRRSVGRGREFAQTGDHLVSPAFALGGTSED